MNSMGESGMRTKVYELIGSLGDGGAETLVKDYAIQLDKSKFDVTVVAWTRPEETANVKRLRENGIRILTVCNKPLLIERVLRKLFGKKYMAYCLGRRIEAEKPDVIHIHLENLQVVSYLSKKLKKIKLFYTCHSIPQQKFGKPGMPEFDAAKLLIERNGLRMIALHAAMADEINRMFGISNTVVVNNGISICRFSSVEEPKASIRSDLGIPENAFVVGHVGRFSRVKNHEFILKLFDILHKKHKNAYLLLVGAGELKNEVIKEITDRGLSKDVLILSNRKDTERLYKAMDVFVFPSYYEGFATAVIEAQAAGLRCFVSDSVPKDTCATDLVSYLSIESPMVWVNAIENGAELFPLQKPLKQYDMPKIIGQVGGLYLMGEDDEK